MAVVMWDPITGKAIHEMRFVGQRSALKYFYAYDPNRFVGACEGQDTQFIMIVRDMCGSVHGYPTNKRELLEAFRGTKGNGYELARFKARFP
jgi:hypothetical protein